MALEKIMPDDMNEVACAMLVYIGENDKQAGRNMSYGDFGKLLQKNHGKRAHGGAYNDCIIHGRADKIHITTISGNEYDMTWNKIAKFIHPYLNSTTVPETVETADTETADAAPAEIMSDNAKYAYTVHAQIVLGAKMVEDGLYQMAKGFKIMRDEKLYKELGYDTFEKYCEAETGIKRRQVYNYIAIAEKLPAEFVQSTAQIGSEKLRLLTALTDEQRTEIAENTDLENTTVKELKRQIDELTGKNNSLESRAADLGQQNDLLREENEKLSEKNRFLKMDYTHEKERNERMLDELKESREKSDVLALELKEARSEAREVIMTDPTESEEYKSILDERNKMHRQIIETTRENDRLKDKQKELLGRYNELYERAKAAADSSGRELTGYFLPVSADEYSAICQQLKGTKYAELLYKAKLIKF